MITYCPKSWSAQARALSDQVVANVNSGAWCLEKASRFWHMSYRHPRIVNRAAKRFGRKLREGKIHESPESVINWNEYKKKYNIV